MADKPPVITKEMAKALAEEGVELRRQYREERQEKYKQDDLDHQFDHWERTRLIGALIHNRKVIDNLHLVITGLLIVFFMMLVSCTHRWGYDSPRPDAGIDARSGVL